MDAICKESLWGKCGNKGFGNLANADFVREILDRH